MKKTTFSQYAIDNSSILYLSLIRKDHTNTYRFTVTLTDTVCPDTLQAAVDRIYRRFPTVIAGFCPGVFHYFQVPAQTAPVVQPDPGCLITMTREEIRSCAYRVYYAENTISIEAFHALADGYGAIASLTTLIAEYLRLHYGIVIPVSELLLDIDQSPSINELEDAYLQHESGKPLHLPSRYAYQLPGGNGMREAVRTFSCQIPTADLLEAAHRHEVSITALLTSVMASAVMEVQQNQPAVKRRPVRIMVPVDLRRLFPSKTLRNFILYALPTMEHDERKLPFSQLAQSFAHQLTDQVRKERLASIMAYNVRTQTSWYFRSIPLFLKCAAMRLAYKYFGESNSSLTFTNLGHISMPVQMQPFVKKAEVVLTPRVGSPYNCAAISCNDILTITISRFPQESRLEEIFSRRLHAVVYDEVFQ